MTKDERIELSRSADKWANMLAMKAWQRPRSELLRLAKEFFRQAMHNTRAAQPAEESAVEKALKDAVAATGHDLDGNGDDTAWLVQHGANEVRECAKARDKLQAKLDDAQPVQTDEECRTDASVAIQILSYVNDTKGVQAQHIANIIAAYRTAAEKKAKAEAWEEAVEAVKKHIRDKYRKEAEPSSSPLIGCNGVVYYPEDVATELNAIPNPYKEATNA